MRSQIIVGCAAALVTLAAVGCSNEPARSPEPQRSQFDAPPAQAANDPMQNNGPRPPSADGPQPAGLPQPQPQQAQFDSPAPQKPTLAVTPNATDSKVLAKTEKPLSDSEIVGVVVAANEGEVEMAEIATKKAQHDDVKQFAGMMKSHHTTAASKAKAMAQKTKLSQSDSEVTACLKASTDDTVKDLKDRDASSFDKAYVDSQVKAHKDVLQAIDNRLMPGVTNGELKTTLTDMRRVVSEHLTKAESIQQKLEGRAATPPTKSNATMGTSPAKKK